MDAYAHPEDQRVNVKIEASDFSAEGLVHLPGIRLSDVMNEKSPFLILVNAVLHKQNAAGQQVTAEHDTLFIRKGEIKYVIPIDERRPIRL